MKGKLFVFILLVFFCSSCYLRAGTWRFPGLNHLQKADQYTREGKVEQAIQEYERHIERRLSAENRPEWENPHFYLLVIGDLHLQQHEPEKALKIYERAEKEQVTPELIYDRYRFVASWYEKEGQLEEAFQLLTKYRSKDELLFDLMLDRISRKIVEAEEKKPL